MAEGPAKVMESAKATDQYVDVQGLVKWFGNDRAVDGVSFSISKC